LGCFNISENKKLTPSPTTFFKTVTLRVPYDEDLAQRNIIMYSLATVYMM